LIEHIGDIDIQTEEEIINIDQQILQRSEERLCTFHKSVHKSIDLPIIQEGVLAYHIMLESSNSLFENKHTNPTNLS